MPNAQVPALSFDPKKVGDRGSIPVIYRYDDAGGKLVEIGTDIPAEIAAMFQATSRDAAVDVTLTPLYIAPSRDRFKLTVGTMHGTAKEYAVVSVSLAQTKAEPVLNGKMLSWAVTYTLIDGTTQDVQDTALSAPVGEDTLQMMHLVDGTAILGLNFTTGTAGGGGLASWLSGAKTISGDIESSKILKLGATSVEAANAAFAALGGILSDLGRNQKFDIDIASLGGIRVAAHSAVATLNSAGVFRIPRNPTKFVFTPSAHQDAFRTALQQVTASGHRLRLDPNNGEPTIVDAAGNALVDADPNKRRGPLAPFTLVVIEASADAAA